mmetsp:Transcript_78698/g.218693  ORF Transcript_78698/g.218693 Transcript_78698/m.218693 type:complete len:84 (-) Transcript_78698:116-367(-)
MSGSRKNSRLDDTCIASPSSDSDDDELLRFHTAHPVIARRSSSASSRSKKKEQVTYAASKGEKERPRLATEEIEAKCRNTFER